MRKRIYITHCTNRKVSNPGRPLYPEELYTSVKTQRFITKCNEKEVDWAIFSDCYGIWFPEVKRHWYEKHPKKVTPEEFKQLVRSFDERLKRWRSIWFYFNPGRFHPLYRKLILRSKLKKRVHWFTHLSEIE